MKGSKLFDEAVSNCFHKTIQRPEAWLQDHHKHIIPLPGKLGGIGIRSATRTRGAANTASLPERLLPLTAQDHEEDSYCRWE